MLLRRSIQVGILFFVILKECTAGDDPNMEKILQVVSSLPDSSKIPELDHPRNESTDDHEFHRNIGFHKYWETPVLDLLHNITEPAHPNQVQSGESPSEEDENEQETSDSIKDEIDDAEEPERISVQDEENQPVEQHEQTPEENQDEHIFTEEDENNNEISISGNPEENQGSEITREDREDGNDREDEERRQDEEERQGDQERPDEEKKEEEQIPENENKTDGHPGDDGKREGNENQDGSHSVIKIHDLPQDHHIRFILQHLFNQDISNFPPDSVVHVRHHSPQNIPSFIHPGVQVHHIGPHDTDFPHFHPGVQVHHIGPHDGGMHHVGSKDLLPFHPFWHHSLHDGSDEHEEEDIDEDESRSDQESNEREDHEKGPSGGYGQSRDENYNQSADQNNKICNHNFYSSLSDTVSHAGVCRCNTDRGAGYISVKILFI
ncbi:hypothetical protein RF11_02201 [Thelohanellus kitauei]|uniref:Uncharacterized protein n=1 Tax=Thelohanellus kitauei TaxID=669202 RepID=A0A0C2J2T0_THEKT|nr:hypothetical protein RF11_02201 [Thelohanellus kitauei]